MEPVQRVDWDTIHSQRLLPAISERDDLTVELIELLDDPEPEIHDTLALGVLRQWISAGVYDGVLHGFGDGLLTALNKHPSRGRQPSLSRRHGSALAISWVVNRDHTIDELDRPTVIAWADRVMTWVLREPATGQPTVAATTSIGIGAEVIAALSASPRLLAEELSVLLDVLLERVLTTEEVTIPGNDIDRTAFAVLSLLHRDLIPLVALEDSLGRFADTWKAADTEARQPVSSLRANAISLLRSLHLQVLLGVSGTPTQDQRPTVQRHPAVRADLLLILQDHLRASTPWLFGDRSTPSRHQ